MSRYFPVVLSTTKTYFDRSERVKSRDTGGGGVRTPAIPFLKASEKYPAKLRWQSSQTLAKKILGETRFASCEVHSVMMNDKTIVNDWIFMVNEEERERETAALVREGASQAQTHDIDIDDACRSHILGTTSSSCVYRKNETPSMWQCTPRTRPF